MDMSSVWGQVLSNAYNLQIQQCFPSILLTQDHSNFVPLTLNMLYFDLKDENTEDSESDIEEETDQNICEETNIENYEEETNNVVEEQITQKEEVVIDKEDIVAKRKNRSINRTRFCREEYQCPQCPYRCTTENAFVKHLRLCESLEQKPLSCPVCGKDRTCIETLQNHLNKHKLGKQFCCDLCKFKSVQLKKIIQHRRMHTGEKPHLCPHCPYRSSRRDNLRSHVRRVHKKEDLIADTFSPTSMLKIPNKRKTIN